MKITVEFNSLQELDEFCNGVVIAPDLAQKAREENAQQPQEELKKAEAKKSTPKSTKAQDEAPAKANVQETEKDARKEEEPAPAEDKQVDVKALKVEVRKMLAQVNKKTGSNTASQWIKELTSVEKLTEVEDAEELLALKAKAEEVLNG